MSILQGRQPVLIGVSLVVLMVAAVLAWRALDDGTADYKLSAERVFKCAECGHCFEHTLQRGEREPLECKDCGKQACWLAETCYWTKDENGTWAAKLEPTYVLLKQRLDANTDEKTLCPDCGHEVTGHNPRPPKELMDAAQARSGS